MANGGSPGSCVGEDCGHNAVNGGGTDAFFDESVFHYVDSMPGPRVNPYTDSIEIFMAALSNTPYDWWVAGTNLISVSASDGGNPNDVSIKQQICNFSPSFKLADSLKYAFNGTSDTEAKMDYRDMVKIAMFMRERFREGAEAGRSWQQEFDRWDWSGRWGTSTGSCSDDPFRGQSSTDTVGTSSAFYDSLTDVDRKFLYSYWRGCFANRQQLFLVFVRAESGALGGAGEGQTPTQLGGRAVALVWRDPNAPSTDAKDDNGSYTDRRPHRMRILFFHQFD